jgi:hypothetical protein
MSVAAETGTAKLIGAIDTSLTNEKNDIAIAQVDKITHLLRASDHNAALMAPGWNSRTSP